MKKISFAIILGTLAFNVIQAQEQNIGINFTGYKNKTLPVPNKVEVTGLNGSFATINDVNSKAVRDFTKSCKKAEGIHWYIDARSTFAYYFINGNKAKRLNDKKGNFVYNILSYPEEFLPYSIRNQVKNAYNSDYTITWVNEVETEGKTTYIVHLLNKTTWLNVRVCDGEMDVLEKFKDATNR